MTSTRKKLAPRCSTHLPEEITLEILLRLLARSVVRFRAVCRSWAALLSSPAFKHDYAVKAGARQATKFVFFGPSAASPKAATAVYSTCAGQHAADSLFTIEGLRPGFLVVSSKPCHGLTLLADTRSLAYWVCNASTGEFRRLPRRRYRGACSAGLAYDSRAKVHKVVQIFYHDDGDVGEVLEMGCNVYTLGTTKWRPASHGLPAPVFTQAVKCATMFEGTTTKVPPVFANGRLHWQLYPYSFLGHSLSFPGSEPHPGHQVAVLCFSAADESFSLVPGPAVEDIVEYSVLDDRSPAVPLHLVELQGSLCMVRDLRHLRHGESLLEIWALRDYSAGMWSLGYRVALTPHVAHDMHTPRFLTVLGCLGPNEGEKILIATSEHKVHAYDPATGDAETVLTLPDDMIGVKEEAVAGIRLGLYEDNFARVGGESRRQKEEANSPMTEILLRLPVKTIGICTLVCKQWRTLIESESFVTSHMLANRELKVMMVTNGRFRKKFFHLMPLDTWLGRKPAETLVDGTVVCSKPCHGLNLISTRDDDYLCNPSTGSIRCLGIAGKSQGENGALTVDRWRSVGLGFDRMAQEHVVVEITRFQGALVCMVKTSCVEYWSSVGAPPRPVTDMPPAHVDGTLYWMSQPESEEAVVLAFDIPTRTFSILPCQPCVNDVDTGPFLVELQGALSLVISNAEEDELRIWMLAREHGTWFSAYKICLHKQPDLSIKTAVVVPLEIDNQSGRILLNTGRALGYYDTRTGTLDLVYSLDPHHLPSRNLAFPMLYVDNLIRIQDDELPDHVTPPLGDEGTLVDGDDRKLRYIFRTCERSGCNNPGAVHTGCCCRRVLCWDCSTWCAKHADGFRTSIPCISPRSAKETSEYYRLPLEHPSVPGSEYCYYYSMRDEEDEDVGRHVFVSIKDLARGRQPCRLVECGYRTDGEVVRKTWARRYREEDDGYANHM